MATIGAVAADSHTFEFGDDFQQLGADPGFDQDDFFGLYEQDTRAFGGPADADGGSVLPRA
eukprot:1958305-Pyramimonas_sp.AAC.1